MGGYLYFSFLFVLVCTLVDPFFLSFSLYSLVSRINTTVFC